MNQEIELICCNIHVLKQYLHDYIRDGYIIDSVASVNDFDWVIIIHLDENKKNGLYSL